jgi:hypothetical protein
MKVNSSRHTTPDALRAMYGPMLRLMQTRRARAGMRRAFDATPSELGRAAVEAGRKGR